MSEPCGTHVSREKYLDIWQENRTEIENLEDKSADRKSMLKERGL